MTQQIQKHFVTFYSPGTFVAEVTEKKISAWDVKQATDMARDIMERHGATPYGFKFTTRGRSSEDLDSKVIAKSPMYFLGGKIETLEEIKARNDPSERMLRMNMEGNGYKRVIINTRSWKWTQPLNDDDIVVEFYS